MSKAGNLIRKEAENLISNVAERSVGLALLLGEEFAHEAGAELARRIPQPVQRVTKTFLKTGEAVAHTIDLVKSQGRGTLRELSIDSPNTAFNVTIYVDGAPLLEKSYTDLTAMASSSGVVEAFQDAITLSYIVHIGTLNWQSSLEAKVWVTQKTVFNVLFAMWDEFL